jgi:hypothetical protein
MTLLAFARHAVWSRPDGRGGTITYYYYDETTWLVAALALAWVVWLIVRRHLRARSLKRRPRGTDYRLLRRVVRLKSELSSDYLRPGFSRNIHAVGVGLLAGGEYCIQIFVGDAGEELWDGAGGAALPDTYGGVPLVLVEMPAAGLLNGADSDAAAPWERYPEGIRDHQPVIVGGISGAHANLAGQSGTIGYFCTRKSKLPRRREVHLLSNSHVFADLRKGAIDDGDLIMQPSPGEPASNRPVGALVNFSALRFDGDIKDPNHVDAAIAKLWGPQPHKPVIPFVGAVKGYVEKRDVKVGEAARKFGRTTGYTEGLVFSVYLDIWVRYDRTGQSAFFRDQLLIEPSAPRFVKFVAKGDSGSLVVDAEQHAIGLVFAGTSEAPPSPQSTSPNTEPPPRAEREGDEPRRIEGYGVANPISEVLERLKIELLL